jgi:hypothetical protein
LSQTVFCTNRDKTKVQRAQDYCMNDGITLLPFAGVVVVVVVVASGWLAG